MTSFTANPNPRKFMPQTPPRLEPIHNNMHVFSDEAKTYSLRVYRLPDGRLGCTMDIARLSATAERFLTEAEAREFLIQSALNSLAAIGENICAHMLTLQLREAVPQEVKPDGQRAKANS